MKNLFTASPIGLSAVTLRSAMACLLLGAFATAHAQPVSSTTQASPATPAEDKQPFDLEADTLTYDTETGALQASGGVQVTGPEGRLRADKLTYNKNTDKIIASGNVVFTDKDDNALLVDSLELSGNLREGALQQMRIRVPELGEVMQASSAVKVSPTVYTLKDVNYSPCKTCPGERKPWTVRAESVTYDQAEAEATYKNAKFDVYGVPVMYLPYFEHPLGRQRPKSGLLMPQFGMSTALGNNVTLAGYMFNPSENADYTVRTRLMSDRGAQLMAERRHTGLTTDSEIRTSYLNDNKTGNIRGHGVIKAQKNFSESRRIGVNANISSDDTYLSEFFDKDDPYLKSTLFAEDAAQSATGDHYLALSLTRFQDLDPLNDPAETAQILPHLQAEKMFILENGGQLAFTGDVMSLYRTEGVRSRRIVTQAEYTKPYLLNDGSRVQLGGTLRGDVYYSEGNTGSNTALNGTSARGLPEVTALWEKPYISPNGFHTITPKAMLALSPRGGNPPEIPNEDSVAYEIDMSNLFEPSRFAGFDRVETGPRIVYGVDNRWGTPDQTAYRVFLGQGLRLNDDMVLPANGGASKQSSDWVGYLEAAPVDWLSFTQNFRLDSSSFSNRRMDTQMRLGNEDVGLPEMIVTYSYLTNGPEELNTRFDVPMTDWVSLVGRTRNDLEDSRVLLAEAGFVFKQDCFEIGLTARRRGYVSGDLQPSTDYLLNLQLLTLGGS